MTSPAMNLYSDVVLLESSIRLLSSKSDADKHKASKDIKSHVDAAAKELSLERFEYFEKEVYQRIFTLILGENSNEKVGGILAVRELVHAASAGTENKLLRISDTLSEALRNSSDYTLLELIADALGHLAKASLVSQLDCIERQMFTALDWLKSPQPHRRFAACLLLRHLAEKAPTVFFAKLRDFFEHIFTALWDPKERIRLVASAAISACLAVLADRTYHLEWYHFIYNQVHEGFKKNTPDSCHGSLLVVGEILTHCGDFMFPRFKEICKAIMTLRDNKSRCVKSAILGLLPQLARYSPDIFARSYLDEAVDLLVKCSKVADLRAETLLSTGKLCNALGPRISDRIDELLDLVKDALIQGSKKSRQEIAPEAVRCIADMVIGLCTGSTSPDASLSRNSNSGDIIVMGSHGQKRTMSPISTPNTALEGVREQITAPTAFQERILSLIEPMLQTGLTQELIDALVVIAERMPSQRGIIKEKLVEEAIKILGGQSRVPIIEPDFNYSWSKKGTRYGMKNRLKTAGYENQASSPATTLGSASITPVGIRSSSPSILASVGMNTNGNLGGSTNTAISTINSGLNNSQNAKNAGPAKKLGFFSFMGGGSKSNASLSNNGNANGNSSLVNNSSVVGVVGGQNSLGLKSPSPGLDVDAVVNQSPALVILALKTLASLIPQPTKLITLLKGSVLPYFGSDDSEVRREAVITCATAISTSGFLSVVRGPASKATEEIIERLVEVMVSDPEPNVRLSLVQSVGKGFEKYLSRPHHIDSLTFLLADESFEIRMEALGILGHLVIINPSTVLPHLRSLLIRLVSELRHSSDSRLKEEATLTICTVMRALPLQPIIKAFLRPMVMSLPFGQDVRLTTAALEAFGEICVVMRKDALSNVEKLMPTVINNIRDSTSRKKQEAAVRTLGQMISASGLVVKPYLMFPQLLPCILDLLYKTSNKAPWTLRREALRTLGILGALEPRKFHKIMAHLHELSKKKTASTSSSSSNINVGTNELFGLANDNEQENKKTMQTVLPTFQGGNLTSGITKLRDRSDSMTSTTYMFQTFVNRDLNSHEKEPDRNAHVESSNLLQSDSLVDEDNNLLPSHLFMYEQSVMRSLFESESSDSPRLLPSHENYFPQVTIDALVKILKDDSMTFHHSAAASTIVNIFRSLDSKSVAYVDQILPYFVKMLRRSTSGLQESLLQHISAIVTVCQASIAPYLPMIFDIITDFWDEQLDHVLHLIQGIALATPDAFSGYVNRVLPLLLSSLSVPTAQLMPATIKQNTSLLKPLEQSLKCCNVLRIVLRPYIHLMVPALCKIINQLVDLGTETHKWLILAIKSLRNIATSASGSLIEQTNSVVVRIVHTLTRTVSVCLEAGISPQSPIFFECIITFCAIGRQVGTKFTTFDASIRRTIEGRGLDIDMYTRFSLDLRSGVITDYSYNDYDSETTHNRMSKAYEGGEAINMKGRPESSRHSSGHHGSSSSTTLYANQKLPLNPQHLARAWDVSQRTTANDWHEWLRRLKVDLIRESPSPLIRACAQLSQSHLPLAHDLFHAAFVSCWQELTEPYQESLVRALHTAFKSQVVPPEILQTLLNLAEFMEHDVEALPISLSILAELAQKSRAYAKALHYRELEFLSSPETCFESLININKKLEQYDAAAGVLKLVSKMQKSRPTLREALKSQETWLAKLGNWEEALAIYDSRLQENSRDSVAISGKLKCLEALGRWEEAIGICNDSLNQLRVESNMKGDNIHTKAAVTGARAAWTLNQWSQMDEYLSQLSDSNVDGSFMRAVLCVHRDDFSEASVWIENTRKQLDAIISALLSESYSRAYVPLITVQQCSELEEVIEFKKLVKESRILTIDTTAEKSTMNMLPHQYNSSLALKFTPQRPRRQATLNDQVAIDPIFQSSNQSAQSEGSGNSNSSLTDKTDLAEKWRQRLRGSCGNGPAAIPFWKFMINGHRLILSEIEDLDSWIEFATLARKNRNLALAERVLNICHHAVNPTLNQTLTPQEVETMSIKVNYATLKLKFACGKRREALEGLESLILSASLGVSPSYNSFNNNLGNTTNLYNSQFNNHFSHQINSQFAPAMASLSLNGVSSMNSGGIGGACGILDPHVHVHCLLKLGQWKLAMIEPGRSVDSSTRREVLHIYHKATQVLPENYRAWHNWGLSNYRAIEEMKASSGSPRLGLMKLPDNSQSSNNGVGIPFLTLAIQAVEGLLRAVSLGTRRVTSSVTQDLLCVLSLWLKYGKLPQVRIALETGLNLVHVDNWLGVIPQLIARIDHAEINSRVLLHDLIVKLSIRHTQALLFPLSVAIKSPNRERRSAAESLMSSLRNHNPRLVDQALLVSQELVRVAIVWEELWHECLEEASRQYYGDNNIHLMIETLQQLHESLEKPATAHEAAFKQLYGKDLQTAWDCIREAKELIARGVQPFTNGQVSPMRRPEEELNPVEKAVNKAWKFYYVAFQNISKRLPSILSLELGQVSPQLRTSRDLELAVPGSYCVSGAAVRIQTFHPTVSIIKSKQRPRKIKIHGEDGNAYVFLLKGHEDLRQDERAMQLFGLVNALLANDSRTSIDVESLWIERYSVIPLSPTAGLISWVPNCDTLHDLIREHRDTRRIILNVEHKLMQQLVSGAQGYDILTLPQKLEVFEFSLSNTAGEDLSRLLWLKSDSSEAWLHRRAHYTRSLATMSMVGYILGLGDRHPSNLMLHRGSGKCLHIDFGDCFEVAMSRDKFPEKVPFRLTRMLVNAMEVAGVHGNYTRTCERVMSVLRENSDSLVATLEAFVYDPLISWRLLNTNPAKPKRGPEFEGTNKDNKEGKDAKDASTTAAPNSKDGSAAKENNTQQAQSQTQAQPSATIAHSTAATSTATSTPAVSSNAVANQESTKSSKLETVIEESENENEDFDEEVSKITKDIGQSTTKSEANPASNAEAVEASESEPVEDLQPNQIHAKIMELATSLNYNNSPNMRMSASYSRNNASLRQMSLKTLKAEDLNTNNNGNGSELYDESCSVEQELSVKAIEVIRRVTDKLSGLDFHKEGTPQRVLEVSEQVEKLIDQAMSHENLCQSYVGWCPFW